MFEIFGAIFGFMFDFLLLMFSPVIGFLEGWILDVVGDRPFYGW